jgi:hypothetical protein
MYHVELRRFPHNLCRFNLTERELHPIAEGWARGEWIELGERKWSPHQAKLTILEGPQLPMTQLAMGRGWRNAQRQSENVTDRILTAAAEAASAASRAPATDASSDVGLPADPLACELRSLLGPDPASLLEAWRLAAARSPERPPSECLALAEAALRPSR